METQEGEDRGMRGRARTPEETPTQVHSPRAEEPGAEARSNPSARRVQRAGSDETPSGWEQLVSLCDGQMGTTRGVHTLDAGQPQRGRGRDGRCSIHRPWGQCAE